MKYGTKLGSDELYCLTKKNSLILLISPFIYSFFFSPMKISVVDFSASIGASAFKFCVHLQVGKVYCVNENKDANPHFAFFSNFQFFLLSLSFLRNYLI